MSLVKQGYTKIILVTGDKDFVPLLEKIEHRVSIWIIGFDNHS